MRLKKTTKFTVRSKAQDRIALFGHFGGDNFGNESTLQAVLHQLRRSRPEAAITCICSHPEQVHRTYGIDAVSMNGVGPRAVWLRRGPIMRWLRWVVIGVPTEILRWWQALIVLLHVDEMIVPGTGLLTDICGLRNWGPYTVFKWSLCAKLTRCKLLFVSVGAGPVRSRVGRWLCRAALALSDFRSYRDETTKRYLASISFEKSGDKVCPDLAFSLPLPVLSDSALARRPVVGIGLMLYGKTLSTDIPSETIATAYLDKLASMVQWLLERNYDIRLLIGDVCDAPVIEEFKALLKQRGVYWGRDRIIHEPITSVENLLFQLGTTELVVATRFHNALLALLLDKPVIAITFHHKCVSLMKDMGLADYMQDIKVLNVNRLKEQFMMAENNVSCLKVGIRKKTTEFRRRVVAQYEVIFGEIQQGAKESCNSSDKNKPSLCAPVC